jgi:hypothetical protein
MFKSSPILLQPMHTIMPKWHNNHKQFLPNLFPSCSQCSNNINYCTSCASPYFLNSITHQCVNSSSGCQNYTYANTTTNTCTQCVSPCLSCVTAASCSSCLHGYYFESVTTLCLDVCPLGWVGIVDVCVRCISPCRYCQASADNCTSCISGYYLNRFTSQCLLQCPHTGHYLQSYHHDL